jgi:DNA end-binding protein Ku
VPDEDAQIEERSTGPRAIWSGTISFGLLSLPVELFPAHRTQTVSLRMVDESGRPLHRRYHCADDERELGNEEIVRGYAVEKDRYVVVTDEELEQVAPEKSREIDLTRFVDVAEIDPIYFNRSYFLTPVGEAAKAYTLLAETMEQSGRAGIATFVMRGKEHIVALLADDGVLRAVTLHFDDEVRKPETIDLEAPSDPKPSSVKAYERAIDRAARQKIAERELTDTYAESLRKRVAAKLKRGEDVAEPLAEDEPDSEAEIIDLMEVLKQRLNVQGQRPRKPARQARRRHSRRRGGDALERLSKDDLYERAKDLDLAGRSKMGKRELIAAIRKASA